MRLSLQQSKEEFKKDLNLTKFYLITEAIDDSVSRLIQVVGIQLVQRIQTSSGGKSGKLKTLLALAVDANRFYKAATNIDPKGGLNGYKRIAAGVVSSIEFYFTVEDLFMVLIPELSFLKEKRDEFLQNVEQQVLGDVDKNPTIDKFLNPNDFGKLKMTILKVLDNKNTMTKDIQTKKFKDATKEVKANPIIGQTQKQRIVLEIGRLTYEEYENLMEITKTILPQIKNFRLSIGGALPEEIREKLLGASNDKS